MYMYTYLYIDSRAECISSAVPLTEASGASNNDHGHLDWCRRADVRDCTNHNAGPHLHRYLCQRAAGRVVLLVSRSGATSRDEVRTRHWGMIGGCKPY